MNNRTRTALIVVALLAVMGAVNYFGGTPAEGPASEADAHAHAGEAADAHQAEKVPAPEPVGPEDAPLKLEVLYEEDNSCQGGVSSSARELAASYAPHVRLELWPWEARGTEERAEEIGGECMVVVALSTRGEDGEWTAPEVAYTAPPEMGNWTWGDAHGLVATKLGDAGIEVSISDMLESSLAATEEISEEGGEAEASEDAGDGEAAEAHQHDEQ